MRECAVIQAMAMQSAPASSSTLADLAAAVENFSPLSWRSEYVRSGILGSVNSTTCRWSWSDAAGVASIISRCSSSPASGPIPPKMPILNGFIAVPPDNFGDFFSGESVQGVAVAAGNGFCGKQGVVQALFGSLNRGLEKGGEVIVGDGLMRCRLGGEGDGAVTTRVGHDRAGAGESK